MKHIKSFLPKNVKSKIQSSDKFYKITGLRCNADELPESLHFMLINNFVFKLPFISDKNVIIENNLHKNINLVNTIISYFDIEEVSDSELNSIAQELNFDIALQPILPDFKERVLSLLGTDETPRKHLYSLVSLILSDVLKRINTKCPFMIEKYKTNGIEEFVKFYSNNSNSVATILNLIESGAYLNKNGKIKKGYSQLLFDICEDSKKLIEVVFKNLADRFSLDISANSLVSSPKSNTLYSLLESITQLQSSARQVSNTYRPGIDSQNISISDDFIQHYNIPEDADTIDYIAVMFRKGFRFEDALARDYSKLSCCLVNTNCSGFLSPNTYRDTYSQDLDSSTTPLIRCETSHNKLIQAENLKANIGIKLALYDMYLSNTTVDSRFTSAVDALTSILNSSYSKISEVIFGTLESEAFQNYSISLCPILYREPECDINYIAKKFKDTMNLQWSDVKIRKVKFSMKSIKDSIRHRYFFPSSHSSSNFVDQKNLVVDTIVPETLHKYEMQSEAVLRGFKISQNINTKTAYAISPFTASLLGCKLIPIEHLCRILGYTKDRIKDMLNIVKERRFNFVFVGAGGTCNNTAIWLSKMVDMCNLPYLFEKVFVFEKDSAELHNMLRFPIDPYTITIDSGIFAAASNTLEKNKCNIIAKELRNLSKLTPSCYEKYIADSENVAAYPSNVFKKEVSTEKVLDENGEVIDFQSVEKMVPVSNTIFYGAPDIITRQNLSNVGNFISATHASNSCNVYINPEQDAMIQVESYGMIQLTPFFMNQLRMTIALLEILSDSNYSEMLSRKDYEFLAYSFNGESVLKNDRVYNFKIIDNPEMATEEQAETAAEF